MFESENLSLYELLKERSLADHDRLHALPQSKNGRRWARRPS